MARKRPGVVATRRIVAGMCIFVGLFVACFGLGNGSQSLIVAGAAIMVLAAAARVVVGFRRTPREYLHGVGRVLEVSDPPAEARVGRCSLQLVVEVPGLPEETVVVHDSRVPVSQWPQPGQRVPIQVASEDVRDVRVMWRDFVPVEMPVEAAWHTDEPDPSPAVPPGSHLDPSPVIDFDLDTPPTGPIEPVAPIDRHSVEPVEPAEAPPAEVTAGDEGRADADTPLTEPDREAAAEPPPTGDDGRFEGTAPPDEVARVAPAAPEGVAAGRVPHPRPTPRRRPEPALVTAGPAGPAGSAGSAGSAGPADGAAAAAGGSEPGTPGDAAPGHTGLINGVGVTMLVGDLARSVCFYRDQLGFAEVDRGEDTTVLTSGDTRLVLRQTGNLGAIRHRLVHLNLEVDDIEAVYDGLQRSGVRFTYRPRPVERTSRSQMWAAAFRDPDGHGVALIQWRAAPDPAAHDA